MKARPDIPPAVSARQHEASDPEVSAWASANAGSGKTHVLTQRVIKLLLGGEDPAKILCITFTKAAAATMATRVFNTLGEWTALNDGALDQAIRDIGAVPDARSRKRARQLFALALETPGGLKVQTIHAFCTRLLHQFPFEAGVGAGFEVLDDATQSQMLETLTLDVMLEGAAEPNKPLGRALAIAIRAAADQTFRGLIAEAVGRRDEITGWVARTKSVEGAIAELSKALGIDPNANAEAVEARILSEASIAFAEWPDLAAVYRIGSKTDHGHADTLDLARGSEGRERLLHYLSIFCTKEMQPRKSLATKKIKDAHPSWVQRLEEEQTRICDLLKLKNAAECRDRTRALVTVAHEVIERYRKAKMRRGLLDYDDLIDRTLDLFRRTSAAWVLYKLDLGIDHILVDEAQDTSPKQWAIVETLVGEFTSGAGARGTKKRTLFVVGDDKQSIFSFQGAAPEKFGAMKHKFASDFSAAELDFRDVSLLTSFRSSEIVLNAVDTVFGREIAYRGLSSDPARTVHEHLPGALPGNVEIWPLEVADPKRDVTGWDAPFDLASETSPQVRLAKRIARHVDIWRGQGGRPGDVLVLVRQRGRLFEEIIRALKDADIPVAGADRMVLTGHIAIMDLMALADALLLPQDDLALAAVLKSPLFGLTEEQLFDIAWNRGTQSLRAALFGKANDYAEAADRLKTLTDAALRESPFTFYARLLGPGGGRKRFLARLGSEANDAIDEFLNLALDYEKRETPSLQGFVAWLRAASAEVKRDMELARDEVRVMTVHGAKGLEAHTVILADTTTPPEGHHPPRLIALPLTGGGGLVWAGAKDTDPAIVAAARETSLKAQGDEYRRLLYVAMTRAERRLVICGTSRPLKQDGTPSIPDECWYRLIECALVGDELTIEVTAEDDETKRVHRYRKSEPVVGTSEQAGDMQPAAATPVWLHQPVAADPVRAVAISPSDSDETDVRRAGGKLEREQALERGRLMHRLIQSLPDIPPQRRQQAAQEFLIRNRKKLADSDRDAIAAQALALLAEPGFAKLFAPGSRAEVPLVGTLPRNGLAPYAVTGQVDRLLVGASEVLLADYKTNRPAPTDLASIPKSYKRQLALYRALLQRIYPGKTVRAALVFTESPILLEIPAQMLDAELATLTGTEDRRA
jgi:ATP-dependent helicase/nuclease subunit A